MEDGVEDDYILHYRLDRRSLGTQRPSIKILDIYLVVANRVFHIQGITGTSIR